MISVYAVRAHGPTGPIAGEQIPDPRPAPGEVLVAVHAAASTAGELSWLERWPAIPGHEVSRTIAALGEGITGVAVGQPVYGLAGFDRDGGAAEYVTVPAAYLAPKPASTGHVGAASLALAALTAWQALVTQAHLKAGRHVLVNGGAGGVGNHAVQLARARADALFVSPPQRRAVRLVPRPPADRTASPSQAPRPHAAAWARFREIPPSYKERSQ